MELNAEMIKLARAAKTLQELQALAEEHQIVLSEEQSQELFAQLNRSGELSDEELDNVAGGNICGERIPNGVMGPCPNCGYDQHVVWRERRDWSAPPPTYNIGPSGKIEHRAPVTRYICGRCEHVLKEE